MLYIKDLFIKILDGGGHLWYLSVSRFYPVALYILSNTTNMQVIHSLDKDFREEKTSKIQNGIFFFKFKFVYTKQSCTFVDNIRINITKKRENICKQSY